MCFYAQKLIEGRQFPTPLENVHDDPQQMGGDFIIDAAGTVILTHCSQISSDRPSMKTLLSAIRPTESFTNPINAGETYSQSYQEEDLSTPV